MKVYNVSIAVVDLISAESEEDAIIKLHRALRNAGFETLEGSEDAFESENL